jgi:uncharacterized membrane protein YbhN (UPF0104 family)
VYTKIDLEKTKEVFVNINYFWIFIAFLFFTASRIIGAIRLNLYFSQIGLKLSQIFNLKLYYLGMFYNLFLPGGIGGDGYKVYFLNKHFKTKATDLIKATVLDRISGLFSLIFLLLILFSMSQFTQILPFENYLYIIVAILVIPISYYFAKYTFKVFLPMFTISSIYAFFLQASQVLTALFILYALNEFSNIINYLTIFLISSVVAVLPLSIGGIGARELTFVYCLEFLNVDFSTGVALSIIFFIMTALSSLIGMFYMSIKPKELKC